MINPMDLSGRHILITGASSGIGRAVAVKASQLGALVSITARRADKLAETYELLSGSGHATYLHDISNLEEIEPLLKEIVTKNGPIDGLVHCAGTGANRPLSMSKPSFLKELMDTSFFAFAELLRLLSKKRFSNDRASLIGISSVAALRGDKAQGAYSAAKAAMNGFIHSCAKEVAARKIRVNTVAFGMIRTDLFQTFQESGGTDALFKDQYFGLGETEDAANIVAFLLSDASRFITGTTLVADGGYLS